MKPLNVRINDKRILETFEGRLTGLFVLKLTFRWYKPRCLRFIFFLSESLMNFKLRFFGLKNVDNLFAIVIVHVSIKIYFPTFLNFQTNSEFSALVSKKNFNLISHYIKKRLANFEVCRSSVASLKGVKSQ